MDIPGNDLEHEPALLVRSRAAGVELRAVVYRRATTDCGYRGAHHDAELGVRNVRGPDGEREASDKQSNCEPDTCKQRNRCDVGHVDAGAQAQLSELGQQVDGTGDAEQLSNWQAKHDADRDGVGHDVDQASGCGNINTGSEEREERNDQAS